MSSPQTPFALFDDNLTGSGDLLLQDCVGMFVCRAGDDIGHFFAHIEAARSREHWIVLAAHYELGLALEPRLQSRLPPGVLLARAWIFSHAQVQTDSDTRCMLGAPDAGMTGDFVTHLSEAQHSAAIRRIHDYILAGDCYQVNLTFPVSGVMPGPVTAHYAALRQRQPVSFGALIVNQDDAILSRSPELFISRAGSRLVARPMKGTAPLAAGADALRCSEKNRAENLMITDLIRNDLGRLVPPGGVRVPSLFSIERYAGLWQMTSTVTAEPVDAPLLQIFHALFPCGSITGAPKLRAMEIIDELEGRPRGLYCGALGWIAPWGDFRFSVPIRTLERDTAGGVQGGIGSGIVLDSMPADEWSEALLKGQFASGRTPRVFGLIETLRWDPAADPPCPLLERHLGRMAGSAGQLGLAFDVLTARERISAGVRGVTGPGRVRLLLSPDGTLEASCSPLDALPAQLRIGLASQRVNSRDPLLRHKTTARAIYDQALTDALAQGLFDVIFLNERSEVCEGARSTVFAEINGELLTPPLSCGLLDGVLRRQLLESGRAREEVLTLADLHNASRVYVGGALRGLNKAELAL